MEKDSEFEQLKMRGRQYSILALLHIYLSRFLPILWVVQFYFKTSLVYLFFRYEQLFYGDLSRFLRIFWILLFVLPNKCSVSFLLVWAIILWGFDFEQMLGVESCTTIKTQRVQNSLWNRIIFINWLVHFPFDEMILFWSR